MWAVSTSPSHFQCSLALSSTPSTYYHLPSVTIETPSLLTTPVHTSGTLLPCSHQYHTICLQPIIHLTTKPLCFLQCSHNHLKLVPLIYNLINLPFAHHTHITALPCSLNQTLHINQCPTFHDTTYGTDKPHV